MESYLLRLRGRQSGLKTVTQYAASALGLAPDPEQFARSPAFSHFVYRDEFHVVEFEFFQAPSNYEVSLRFSLCHPISVRRVFLSLAQSLMSEFNMTATICEVIPEGEPRDYSAYDERFAANCLWSMERSQEMWKQMFGPVEAGVSVSEALRRFFINSTADSKQVNAERWHETIL